MVAGGAKPDGLPGAISSALDKRLPGWRFSQVSADVRQFLAERLAGASPHLIRGDFDGDGRTDYAALIEHPDQSKSAGGSYVVETLAFLKRGAEYKLYVLEGSKSANPELYKRVVTLALLVALAGCAEARRAARSPETDAPPQAARAGHADTVKGLLAGGKADVNGRDEQGDTPLIEAARLGHDDVVQALLVARADPGVKNDGGQTALAVAAQGGHDEIVRLLRQAGAAQ